MSDTVIKTARRLIEVLEYFDDIQRPMSLHELAMHFSYPRSSASLLLKSMVVMGYLDYDSFSRTYLPTMRMAKLGNWVQGVLFGEVRIVALMKSLHETFDETISVGGQSDLYAQYIDVIPSNQPLRTHLKPGTLRPLARSGLGHLLLSARTDDVIDKLLRRINIKERDRSLRIPLEQLMTSVRQVRDDGYVFSRSIYAPGSGYIAVLLPIRRNGRILAIGMGGPLTRLEARREEMLAALRQGVQDYIVTE